jgi:hypothetical protein
MIYCVTASQVGTYEWEVLGYVKTDSFPVEVVDRLQGEYGNDYSIYAEPVEELK